MEGPEAQVKGPWEKGRAGKWFQKALEASENEAAQLSSLPMQATVLLLKNLKPHFTPRRLYFGRA